MRYDGMPGQGIAQPPNPAGSASSNSPFNFMTNPGRPGVGSNQYGSLPPWMNVTRPGLGPQTPPATGGGAQSSNWFGLPAANPIGPERAPMNPQMEQQFNQWLASGTANPQYVGSFAQGGNIPGGTIGPPVYGGSPIPAGSTGVPGYYSAGGAGYGLGVPSAGGGFPAPTGSGFTGAGGGPIQGGGLFSVEQSAFPNVSNELGAYLASQVGKGATPFNLATALPFGGYTQAGQLNAPADPILQSLHNFYSGGQSNMPGANTLATIANQGISALPEWQATVAAEGQNIAQNEAQLREQSAYGGGGAGSPMAASLSNYLQGATAQQNAMLAQMQQQNILQGQIPVAEALLSGGQQFGQYSQALAQQNIQNMYNEFLRTRPEYSPTLGYQFGAATTYDPVLNRAGQTQGSGLDAILGNLGPILTGLGSLGL